MSVLRDYELWSLAKFNVDLMSSGTTGIRQETRAHWRDFWDELYAKIDMFTGRLALALVLVLDASWTWLDTPAQTSFPPNWYDFAA